MPRPRPTKSHPRERWRLSLVPRRRQVRSVIVLALPIVLDTPVVAGHRQMGFTTPTSRSGFFDFPARNETGPVDLLELILTHLIMSPDPALIVNQGILVLSVKAGNVGSVGSTGFQVSFACSCSQRLESYFVEDTEQTLKTRGGTVLKQ